MMERNFGYLENGNYFVSLFLLTMKSLPHFGDNENGTHNSWK